MKKNLDYKILILIVLLGVLISFFGILNFGFTKKTQDTKQFKDESTKAYFQLHPYYPSINRDLNDRCRINIEIVNVATITEYNFKEYKFSIYKLTSLGALVGSGLIVIFKKASRATSDAASKNLVRDVSSGIIEDGLSKEEKIVLGLIVEYINHNRVLKLEKLVPYLNSRLSKSDFNLNTNGLRIILVSLVEKNLIVEGSKITKGDLLLNSNRKQIYDYVKSHPGVYLNELVMTLGLSIFIVSWHLNILLKFNLIRRKKINNFIAYYDFCLDSKNDRILHILLRKSCRKLVEFLKSSEHGHTKYQISKELKMHYHTITKSLEILDDFCLLSSKNSKSTTYYSLNHVKYACLTNGT